MKKNFIIFAFLNFLIIAQAFDSTKNLQNCEPFGIHF
jgi:hypothetical protein